MPRYIIFTQTFFTPRDWNRFCCDEARADGYEVVAVEIGHLVGLREALIPRENYSSADGVVVCESMSQLERFAVSITRRDVVLVQVSLSLATRPFFRLLKKHDVAYSVAQLGHLPEKLGRLKLALSWRELLDLSFEDVRGRLWRWKALACEIVSNRCEYFSLKGPRLWLTAGTAASSISVHWPWLWQAKRVHVASLDFAAAQKQSSTMAKVESSRTAIFLDEAFVDHPDFVIHGLTSPATRDVYWNSLEKLFRAVERNTNLKVVVAPHPKSSGGPQPFASRRGRGTTAEMVRSSDLVLCHASTAVSFAVIFRKPLLFVTTDELEKSPFRGSITRMASHFGLRPVNADRFKDSDLRVSPVDSRAYKRYETLFLRAPDAFHDSFWKVLLGQHAKIFQRSDRHGSDVAREAVERI